MWRERQGESSRCVEMDPLQVRTITQCLQLFTRLNSTNRILHLFFLFSFSCSLLHMVETRSERNNFGVIVEVDHSNHVGLWNA